MKRKSSENPSENGLIPHVFHTPRKNTFAESYRRPAFSQRFFRARHKNQRIDGTNTKKKPDLSVWLLWSEWRESNSRPLEPHSSALPKLRYTRISRSASLPKRGDKRYYTQARPFCQQIFRLFLVFFEKSPIFTRIRTFSFLLFFSVFPLLRRAACGRVPAAGAGTGR